jgi:hypothetical protein
MSFVQRAQGSFTVEVHGEYHCGPNHDSPKEFTYEVEIHYPEEALDENGFLLDNLFCGRYFNSLGSTELSCERLARKAAMDLHSAARMAKRTAVGIWAIPGAAKIEYTVSDSGTCVVSS